jgi:hypothetical protein
MLSSICQAASIGLAVAPGAPSPRGFIIIAQMFFFGKVKLLIMGQMGNKTPLAGSRVLKV